MKLVECVPNFSEGRDMTILNQIKDVIESVDNVTFLDMDPGAATNRTVVTFVGPPDAVAEAAFQAIKKASEIIDMSGHTGAHARMGATDVCPFVPVANITMEECVEIAKKVGKRVGEELNIPIYLYEYAASKPEFKNLANVRQGEYEGLKARFESGDEYWTPDFGPAEFNAKSGATAISAREFLIAYNINMNTRAKKLAHDIALDIREKGRTARDAKGKIMKDENGKKIMKPGLFKDVKAVGWYIDEFKQAQISINFTNYKVSPPHVVLEKVRELAINKGMIVTGSELVGLVPKEAMITAGKYYLEKQGRSQGIPERDIIDIAIKSMGLADIAEFDMDEKVIEFAIQKKGRLVDMTAEEFADELSRESAAPGGGSVAALAGALAGGLSAMVANLTQEKKKLKKVHAEMNDIAQIAQKIKDDCLYAIDSDTDAFNLMINAMRLPKKTDEEIKIRDAAIQDATKEAINVPLSVMKNSMKVFALAKVLLEKGLQTALSDATVSGIMALGAIKGAYFNVKINMEGIEDAEYKDRIMGEANAIWEDGEKAYAEIEKIAKEKI